MRLPSQVQEFESLRLRQTCGQQFAAAGFFYFEVLCLRPNGIYFVNRGRNLELKNGTIQIRPLFRYGKPRIQADFSVLSSLTEMRHPKAENYAAKIKTDRF